jgi:hypothetical protein
MPLTILHIKTVIFRGAWRVVYLTRTIHGFKEITMKRLLMILLMSVGMMSVMPAQAHWHGERFEGGYHGGGGWHTGWVLPAVGGALVGSALYAATSPHYMVSSPPVVMSPPVQRTAYFCPTSQQYYPNVPVCNMPWQVVGY